MATPRKALERCDLNICSKLIGNDSGHGVTTAFFLDLRQEAAPGDRSPHRARLLRRCFCPRFGPVAFGWPRCRCTLDFWILPLPIRPRRWSRRLR